jgi:multisubunit Na+/H+ antiporter MnhB subunit
VTVVTASVVLLNAAFGLEPHESSILWWVFSAIAALFSLGLLFGLYVASKEQPFPG